MVEKGKQRGVFEWRSGDTTSENLSQDNVKNPYKGEKCGG
jgi:hypothetical protein